MSTQPFPPVPCNFPGALALHVLPATEAATAASKAHVTVRPRGIDKIWIPRVVLLVSTVGAAMFFVTVRATGTVFASTPAITVVVG